MKIGIFGNGMVGGTLANWLKQNTSHDVALCDPPKGLFDDFTDAKAIFICIPVPTIGYFQELDSLNKVIDNIVLTNPTAAIFIKSTVLPGTTQFLSDFHDIPIYSCPEFLTERTRDADFASQPVLVGGYKDPNGEIQGPWEMVKEIFPNKNIIKVTNEEAEMTKYAHNCFGALKVTYFNLINELCSKMQIDFETVRNACFLSGYIEKNHTLVPGPDGKKGFGGVCFPKDLAAFTGFCVARGARGAPILTSIGAINAIYRES